MSGYSKVAVPHGAYWSTPFARWQSGFSHLHAMEFAAHVAKEALADRKLDTEQFDHAVLGMTIPQEHSFYGLPWLTSMIGMGNVSGAAVSQACATSARCLSVAANDIEQDNATASLVVACDRTSNAPVVVYPNPQGMAGAPGVENWVLSNFSHDPIAGTAMVGTAENCARDWQISTDEQHDVVARRFEQYEDSRADDCAFQKRYMKLPFEVPDQKFRKSAGELASDDGIRPSTREGLSKLKPVMEGGTVTYGGQTHPADGNAGMVLTTPEKAREMARNPDVTIEVRSFGQARVKPAYMPSAPVPAAKQALAAADIDIKAIDAIKTHNPFAVNDLVFARETGVDVMSMNNYGCSLIYGHPQGPTGMRLIIELIEELVERGGGTGLFTGCAAGDTGMATIVDVRDRSKAN